MGNKNICFYHRTDIDGKMSAVLCALWHERKHESIHLIDYGYEPINLDEFLAENSEVNHVYFLDSYPGFHIFEGLIHQGIKVTYIDHHKSSIKDLIENNKKYGIFDTNLFTCVTQTKASAAKLTWNWFFGNDYPFVPKVISLIDIYDRWVTYSPDWYSAQYLNSFLKNANWDVDDTSIWENTLLRIDYFGRTPNLHDYLEKGRFILNVMLKENTRKARTLGGTLNWEMVNFFAYNCYGNSEIVGEAPIPGVHRAILLYSWEPCHKMWQVSLFHQKNRLNWSGDLSCIAIKYGGGGHSGACGFNCTELPFDLSKIEPLKARNNIFL